MTSSLALVDDLTIDSSPLIDDDDRSGKDLEEFAPLESEGELQVSFSSLTSSEAANSHHLDFLFSLPSLFPILLFPIASTSCQEDGDDGYDQCSEIYKLKDFIVEKIRFKRERK